MLIDNEIKLDFNDVLIRPKRSTLTSRKQVDLNCTYRFKHSHQQWTGIPIVASNMDGVGTIAMAKALLDHGMFTCLVKSYGEEDLAELRSFDHNGFAVSTGTNEKDFQRLSGIINAYPGIKFICVDVANGYSEHFGDYIQDVREAWPNKTIVAGNVVTADMTQELVLRGADIVKIGIGQGSVCTTRSQTGVGYPQLSAIIECSDAAHGLGAHIIADGGCTCPGDLAKAFGAGADFVMLGGMLAGHDEGGGEVWEDFTSRPARKYIEFYGMSSKTAMEKHHGGVAEYRSSEGRTVQIPYKGPVNHMVLDLLGGIRSACTYVGALTLKQLPKCTTFVRVNRQMNDIFVK